MKSIKILTIILAITLMVSGCNTNQETSKQNENTQSDVNSDNIHLTMVKPKTINPITNKDKSVGFITNLIYDSLFTINENYDVVPQLVEEYGISQDGMSISIKLKDAKWHDQSEVTSSDVKFTVDFIQRNVDSPYKIFTDNISSVSVTNNKEFTLRFKQKYAFSIDTLIFPIISQKQLASVGTTEVNSYKKNLIGNGPYKIERYEERNGMILAVNENYHDELPKTMKNIEVGIVPDQESQVSMVMALESDIANISLNDLSKFHEKEFKITNYEGRDYEYVAFNFNNIFLRDVNFRKAVAHAINKNTILEEGYMKDAISINFPLNSKSKYYDKDLKALDYDKEKAKSYLEKVNPISEEELQAELKKENANNNSENNKADTSQGEGNPQTENSQLDPSKEKTNDQNEGKEENSKKKSKEDIKKMISKLDLKIIVNKENGERAKSAYVISENLKAVGIKSTVHKLTVEEMDKALNEKDYDLAMLGWELSSVPDVTSITGNSGYSDEKLTNYTSSLLEATTENQIKDIYKSIQKHIRDNVAFISLVIREDYIVTNKRLDGKIYPNDFDVYEGIANLNIKNK